MKSLKKVQAVTCNDGDWFVIPNKLLQEFQRLNESEDQNDIDEFEDKFSEYRTGGELNIIQLYAAI